MIIIIIIINIIWLFNLFRLIKLFEKLFWKKYIYHEIIINKNYLLLNFKFNALYSAILIFNNN